MSLFNIQPESTTGDQTTLPEALSVENKSSNTTLYPESKAATLLKYVEGYPWTVNFYGQLLSDSNIPTPVDPGTISLLQPYYKVSGLIIQVNSPLTTNYNETTGVTVVTGSGLFPFGLVPNKGDVFIASVDSGEDAIFVINSVIRKTHRKESIYEVNYSLYSYATADTPTVNTLEGKVQELYFFNKDTNYFNRDLLITSDVKEAQTRLKGYLAETQEYYLKTFAHKDAGALFLPGTATAYYDPHIVELLSRTMDYSKLITYPFFKFTYRDKYVSQDSFITAFMSRDLGMLNNISKTQGFVRAGMLYNRGRFGTVYHAGVDCLIYPKTPRTDADIESFTLRDPITVFETGHKTAKNHSPCSATIRTRMLNTEYDKLAVHDMFEDDYYIVSGHFYDYVNSSTHYAHVSFVELLFYKFMKKEAIAREDLVLLMETYRRWSPLHQFYLLPLLWVIIRNTL